MPRKRRCYSRSHAAAQRKSSSASAAFAGNPNRDGGLTRSYEASMQRVRCDVATHGVFHISPRRQLLYKPDAFGKD
jgi:hypothetical protein